MIDRGSAARAREGSLTEWLLRAFAVLAIGFIVARWAYAWWMDPTRWTALLLLVSETYTLALILVARRATIRDMSPLAGVATLYACFCIALLDPNDTIRLAPEAAGVVLQVVGGSWQFASKVALGRSFGLLPAQRGVVVSGPYRLLRHPIYFGYLVSHAGFLLANFSWRNAAVLAVLYVAQVIRIQREEAVLASDGAYRQYQQRVRWRLLPLVF